MGSSNINNNNNSGGGYLSLSIKAVAVSAAVVSTAVMLHQAGPTIVRFAYSEAPARMYGSLLSWLAPPYLYLVINGIIISIAASSRFHHHHHKSSSSSSSSSGSHDNYVPGFGSSPATKQDFIVVRAPTPHVQVEEEEEEIVSVSFFDPAPDYNIKGASQEEEEEEEDIKEEFVRISRSSCCLTTTPKSTTINSTAETEEAAALVSTEYYSFLTEKPLASSRLGRRKSLKPSPDQGGKAGLGVARPKRNDTLESTWRAITDGRAVPLNRHLKKSADTRERETPHRTQRASPDPAAAAMRKSETFHERGGARRPSALPSPSRLRKEPSIGQEDLNRRVEAFIRKFNEDMRLQRQESYNHYLDMINRGSH